MGRRNQTIARVSLRGRHLIGPGCAALIGSMVGRIGPQEPDAGQQGGAKCGANCAGPMLDQAAFQTVGPASTAPATS